MRKSQIRMTTRSSLLISCLAISSQIFTACADTKADPTGGAAKLAAKNKGANAKEESQDKGSKLDKVVGQIAKAFKGMTFYDGIYNVQIKMAIIECGGEFPIRLRVPDPDKGVTSPLDFMGSKIQCFGIDLPLDEIISGLLPKPGDEATADGAPAPSGPLFGLANDGGVIGVTRLGPVTMAPLYPILPDILATSAQDLKVLNKTLPVKLTSPSGATESGSVAVNVTKFDSAFTLPSGKSFNKTMVWQVKNSGFQKIMLGPHLLSNLEVALSMDPLAVPHIAFDLAVMEAGAGAFQTILESDPEPPEFLKLLVDTIKTFKDFPLLSDLKFEFKADLVRFIDGGEEMMRLRQRN